MIIYLPTMVLLKVTLISEMNIITGEKYNYTQLKVVHKRLQVCTSDTWMIKIDIEVTSNNNFVKDVRFNKAFKPQNLQVEVIEPYLQSVCRCVHRVAFLINEYINKLLKADLKLGKVSSVVGSVRLRQG